MCCSQDHRIFEKVKKESNKMTEVVESLTDEYQFGKPMDRKEIQDKIPEYLASGGTIKRITLEKGDTM